MRDWDPERVAAAAGARLVQPPSEDGGPVRAVIDSRAVEPGDLFAGLRGASADGGRFAGQALAAGAWGVLAAPEHAEAVRGAGPGAVLAADDPLAALQRLATERRRALGATVIGITGSTGKTSTKDILAGMLAPHRRTYASRANFNTEIGVPLGILEAPDDAEVLVLEMAMRGSGQIAELGAIAEPDVGVIVNIGPVHLELLGSLEAIAAAKAELVAALPAGGTAVVPAGEALLEPHRREDVRWVEVGDGGDVRLVSRNGGRLTVADEDGAETVLELPLTQAHHAQNALTAWAAALAAGVAVSGPVDVSISALRGEELALTGGVVVVNDCYNANPMSMRAALDHLAAVAPGRRVAVLGDMLELGPDATRFHREIGAHARAAGVDLLVAVGDHADDLAAGFGGETRRTGDAAEAAELVPGLVADGDTVLVKASRGVALETIAEALEEARGSA
jgi:UDP-N-acetylmuramoyl-tripeptide--D-alanyl-D-alanine ligase